MSRRSAGADFVTEPLLQLKAATHDYPGVRALDHVDFELRGGEVHALVGENGAGKSTLIQILCGVLRPDRGELFLDGRPIDLSGPTDAHRLGIVAVHQEAELFPLLSVAENMALTAGLPRRAWGAVDWSAVGHQANQIVTQLAESIDVKRPAGHLCIAHRHMIQVAAAVVRQARVVILDEPTSALSDAESRWLFGQIERLRDNGVAVLYISHRLEEVFSLSQRITVLRDGHEVWSGKASQIDRPGLVEAMVGRPRDPKPVAHRGSVPPGAKPLLRCEKLTDRARRYAAIDLTVYPGEVVGVYGLIGAGRSEWAQGLIGLETPASGRIVVDGAERTFRRPADAVACGIAYVPEDRLRQGLCRGLSIRENAIIAALSRWGLWRSSRAENQVVAPMTRRLDVRLRSLEQPIGQLSGGNQQKVVVGRWLLTEPRIFILDEPTRGVDVAAKQEMHKRIRDWADEGRGVVLITSELTEVLDHSDRIVVFRAGRIAAEFDATTATALEVASAALPRPDEVADDPAPHAAGKDRWRFGALPWGELVLGVAIAALVLVLWLGGSLHSPDAVARVVSNAAVNGLLALAAACVILARGIDISIGALLGLSAGAAALTMAALGNGPVAAAVGIFAGLAIAAGGGAVNATLSLVGRIHPIIVTLGTMAVYRGLLIAIGGGRTLHAPVPLQRLVDRHWLGLDLGAWILLVVAAGVWFWLNQTTSGRAVYAWGGNPAAARLIGIRQSRVWLSVFVVAGTCVGLAGLLEFAQTGAMQSRLGAGYELRAITAAVLGGVAITGGRGTVVGVVLGALLLSLFEMALVNWQVSRYHYDLVSGGLLTAAILSDRLVRMWEQ